MISILTFPSGFRLRSRVGHLDVTQLLRGFLRRLVGFVEESIFPGVSRGRADLLRLDKS